MAFRKRTFLVGVFLLVLLFSACSEREEGTKPDPGYDTLIESGKRALEVGDGKQAVIFFEEAARIRPGDSQANLGIGISIFLQIITFADEAIDFATGFGDDGSSETEGEKGDFKRDRDWTYDPERGTGDVIDLFIREIFDELMDDYVEAMDLALIDPNLIFEVGPIPIVFQSERILLLKGNWEYPDIIFFDVFARLLRTGIDLALSINLDLNFPLIMDFLLGEKTGLTLQEMADELIVTVHALLTDPENPDFLLLTEEGAWRMPRSGINLGLALDHLLYALDTVWDPVGPLGYIVQVDNGIHDPSEPYSYGSQEPLGPEIMNLMPSFMVILEAMKESLWDHTEMDVDPENGNPFDPALFNLVLQETFLGSFLEIPSKPVDLGAFFLAPDFEGTKEKMVGSLECILDATGLFDLLGCFFGPQFQ